MVERYAVAVADARLVKSVKTALETLNWLDKSSRIAPHPHKAGTFLIPVCIEDGNKAHVQQRLQEMLDDEATMSQISVETAPRKEKSPLERTLHALALSQNVDEAIVDDLCKTFPKTYSVYPPLLLLPLTAFQTLKWQQFLALLSEEQKNFLWESILSQISTPNNPLTHLAINKPILEEENIIRSPTQLTVLYGDFSNFWCHSVQNGIYQTWMPMHTMFSRGNIKEKARILSSYEGINEERDVVDLYAGIGYFTLSYLQRRARRVFCWEINPYSVEGLARGVRKNGFGDAYVVKRNERLDIKRVMQSRCVVFLESNEFCLERMKDMVDQANSLQVPFQVDISHINLGLLPTSTGSWPYACALLEDYVVGHGSESSSWIHVHENVGVKELDTFMDETNNKLQEMLLTKSVTPVWLEKVKTFAPDVYHIVGDFKVQ